MSRQPPQEIRRGSFLIASPDIDEGIFYRSVVLVCEHSALGSLGVIVNKPLEIEEADGEYDPSKQVQMRVGGPSQTDQILLIQNRGFDHESSLEISDGIYLNGEGAMLIAEEEQILPDTLVCFGYGGWASGVLEREWLNRAWFLTSATSTHLFQTPPETLWQMLLREMGGKYKALSNLPENIELN